MPNVLLVRALYNIRSEKDLHILTKGLKLYLPNVLLVRALYNIRLEKDPHILRAFNIRSETNLHMWAVIFIFIIK